MNSNTKSFKSGYEWAQGLVEIQSCFLLLHEIVEGLYFHCSLSVCVCVCVSNFLVNKIPAERMHRFGRGFR